MKRRKLTEEEFETMAALREGGATMRSIAEALGCSIGTVSYHCLRLGIDAPKPYWRPFDYLTRPIVKRGNHVVRAFTPGEDEKLVELALQGLNNTEIGRALGRAPNSIGGRLMTLARREERAA